MRITYTVYTLPNSALVYLPKSHQVDGSRFASVQEVMKQGLHVGIQLLEEVGPMLPFPGVCAVWSITMWM